MSCLQPRRFPNPIKDSKRSGFDKFTIQGSCGRCSACNKRKQNDWLVRGYFEYMSKPTSSFFVTLDFDEEHLPRYRGEPCFDSKLMSTWFETLRQVLPKFRYMYSSHYGEALHRPHYHVLFFFDKDAVSFDTFWTVIVNYWKYGSHENIQKLRSVRDNPLAALEYVCRYTTRDTRYLNMCKQLRFPDRYRPRTYASVGFGAQALDPSEFKSERLIKEGVVFQDTPTITREFILNNSLVYLDIKRDGILVPFAIPRYYEMKLMYDWSWNRDEQKQDVSKNDYGKQLQQIRHNADYLHLFNEFKLSETIPIHKDYYTSMIFSNVFPESPYNGMLWKDIVNDVLQDEESFFDFCKLYSWIEFDCRDFGFSRYRPLKYNSLQFAHSPDKLSGHYYRCAACDQDHPSWIFDFLDSSSDLYIQAISYYKIWKDVQNLRISEFEDFQASEKIKEKIRQKCKNNSSFYWHLRHHGFKFYTLNPSTYVSHYQIKED